MHPFAQFFRQHRIHHAMLLDARFPTKGLGHDLDAEMAFADGAVPGMTLVPVGLVQHL